MTHIVFLLPKKIHLQGKLGVMEGRIAKGGKRGRMSLKALALSSAETGPSASPVASDTGIVSNQEAEAENSLRLEASNSPSPSPRADLSASNIADKADVDNSHSPTAAKKAAAASLSDGEEGASAEVTNPDALPRSVSPVPVTHATPSKRPKRLAIPQSNASDPEACPKEATPSKPTPSKVQSSKVTPNKATPSKVTPSKRAREAAGGSPGWVAEHAAGVEAAVQGGTPGKRRRSLLPPAMLSHGPIQVKAVCSCCFCFNDTSASPAKACFLHVASALNLCRLLESSCLNLTVTALLRASPQSTESPLHEAAADTTHHRCCTSVLKSGQQSHEPGCRCKAKAQ